MNLFEAIKSNLKDFSIDEAFDEIKDYANNEWYLSPYVRNLLKNCLDDSDKESSIRKIVHAVNTDSGIIGDALYYLCTILKQCNISLTSEERDFEKYLDNFSESDIFTDDERETYGIDEDGFDENGDEWIHCEWCGEAIPKSECKKELNLGWICPDCQNALYSRGEKATYVYDEAENLYEAIKSNSNGSSRKGSVNKALLDLFNEVYDSMGEMYALDEWAETLADSYDIDAEGKDAGKVILTALNKMSDESFKDEVDNFIYGLFENGDVEYLRDTLHEYRNREYIIKCFNLIKPYATESDKIDKAISELQDVNLDLRTTAKEFQSYLHDNFHPWEVLGTTTGPRTYVDLFDVPTDYDIVGADYFNYADRPNDMLDNIGYGWKQDGDNIVADLIGFGHSVKGSSIVYDQEPVSYGYTAIIDKSNKEEKFKEMAEELIKKAREIKSKYKLGK